MISGNYISNIFEKNKNPSTNFEKITFKSILNIPYDEAVDSILKFFNQDNIKTNFSIKEKGKVSAEIIYQGKEIQIFIFVFKLNKFKFIFIDSFLGLSYKISFLLIFLKSILFNSVKEFFISWSIFSREKFLKGLNFSFTKLEFFKLMHN
jgi:ribosomal protein L21